MIRTPSVTFQRNSTLKSKIVLPSSFDMHHLSLDSWHHSPTLNLWIFFLFLYLFNLYLCFWNTIFRLICPNIWRLIPLFLLLYQTNKFDFVSNNLFDQHKLIHVNNFYILNKQFKSSNEIENKLGIIGRPYKIMDYEPFYMTRVTK